MKKNLFQSFIVMMAAVLAITVTLSGQSLASVATQSLDPFVVSPYSGNTIYGSGEALVIGYKNTEGTVLETMNAQKDRKRIALVPASSTLFKTADGRPAWVNITTGTWSTVDLKTMTVQERIIPLNGLPQNTKVVSACMEGDQLSILLDKKGVFLYNPSNTLWESINAGLPIVENTSDVSINRVYIANGEWYALSRTKGVFKLNKEQSQWSLLAGLERMVTEVKAFYTFDVVQKMYRIGTKTGVIEKTVDENNNAWKYMKGTGDEIESTFMVNSTFFVYAHEEKRLYALDGKGILRQIASPIHRVLDGKVTGIAWDGKKYVIAADSGFSYIDVSESDLTPAAVAKSILSLSAIPANRTSLIAPKMPYGFKATIAQSSQPNIINLKGEVIPPKKSTVVQLVLKVSQEGSKITALTKTLSVTVPAAVSKKAFDGIYTAEAKGYNDLVKIEATVTGGVLTGVKVLDHRETDSMNTVKEALSELPNQMVSRQTLQVDSITGATYTSRAILTATNQALQATPLFKPWNPAYETLDGEDVEGLVVLKGKNKTIYAQYNKTQKSTSLYAVEAKNTLNLLQEKLPMVDVGLIQNNDTVLTLLGAKESPILLRSADGGNTWETLASPKGLPKEKIDSALITQTGLWIISINKYGLYQSEDQGLNWKALNDGVPINPDVFSEPDTRKTVEISNNMYLLTKKNGLFKKDQNGKWQSLTPTLLSFAARDVWDVIQVNDSLYISTKAGVFHMQLSHPSQWQLVAGINEETRQFQMLNGKAYILSKGMTLYNIEKETAKKVTVKPANLTATESKALILSESSILIPNKTGLIQLELPPEIKTK